MQTAGEYGGSDGRSFWTTIDNTLDAVLDQAGEHWLLVMGVAVGIVLIGVLVRRGRQR